MKNLAYWWVFFWVQLVGVGIAWYFGFIGVMWAADVSNLTAVIGAIWIGATLNIGIKTHAARRGVYNKPLFGEYLAYAAQAIGMVGTLIGFIVLVSSSGIAVDSNVTPEALKQMLGTLTLGIGTAVWTTLVGLVASVCIIFQLNNLEILITRKKKDAAQDNTAVQLLQE